VAQSERYSAARIGSEEEQGQRWLIVAYVLVIGLLALAVAERLAMGKPQMVIRWLPFMGLIGLQLGMMAATWLGHRWARWALFLLLLREALVSFQLVLNFSNLGLVITFSIYLVALYLVGLANVGEFVRQQHRKYQMSTGLEPRKPGEKAAFLSLMCPAAAMIILLSRQPVPRDGYDAGPLVGLGAAAALAAGVVMGAIALFAASQQRLAGVLRTAIAGTSLCGILGTLWIWAAAGWPDELENARMWAAQQTKHYLPIQTTVLQLEVADQIKIELGKILHKSPSAFDTRKPLMTQGLNDLQLVELVLAMERAFQVKVPDGQLGAQTGEGSSTLTIDQLADAIAGQMKSKVSTGTYTPD
jgi:acyl carrier protein